MIRPAILLLGALAGLALLPASGSARARAQEEACYTTWSERYCTSQLLVGDPDYPCVVRDGHAYCPVVTYYYPSQIILV